MRTIIFILWQFVLSLELSIIARKVNNPAASCGALGEKVPPRNIPGEVAFIRPAR
jgi:hypothetical protein